MCENLHDRLMNKQTALFAEELIFVFILETVNHMLASVVEIKKKRYMVAKWFRSL
jgi:hypothetical protein